MKAGEKNLLLAVRNRLRLPIVSGGAGFPAANCNIEFDEMAPATVGDFYIVVMPGGWRPGPRHNSSGGVNDLVYGVRVAVIKRIGNVPRDRLRDTFLTNLDSLNAEIDKIFPVIDFKYEILNEANSLITAELGTSEGFIEPLRLAGDVSPPRQAPAELFGGDANSKAGMMRVVPFHGARRITVKT